MQGWVIYQKDDAVRNCAYIGFLQTAFAARGSELCLRYAEHFTYGTNENGLFLSYEGQPSSLPDFVIMRAALPIFSQHLEWMGCRVFNTSDVSRIANDKLQTLQLAARLGLCVPVTRLATKESAPAIAAALRYPLVMKPRDGHGGRDVVWITSATELDEKLQVYGHTSFLLQKPTQDLGRDLRVYVMGGEIVAGMLRSCDTEFRSNFCLGGRAEPYRLTPEVRSMTKRLMQALPMDYAGIDFMFSGGKPVFNEIEDVVGARMLYSLTDIDIADRHAAYILHLLRQL